MIRGVGLCRTIILVNSCLIIGGLWTRLVAAAPEIAMWREFRGPNGSGVAVDCHPPVTPSVERPTWRVTLPPGHSSPVLSHDLVIVTAIDNGRLVTLAFHPSNGELAWRSEAPEVALETVHETSSPASSTPCVDDKRIVVYFGSIGLLCYDHQGHELWRHPLPVPKSLYGASSSPIMDGERVLLVIDDDANLDNSQLSRSRLIAVDQSTGKLVWETPRPLHRSGWSTPTIWRHAGGDELVVLGDGRLDSYDLVTGAEKWSVDGFSRETIARPIIGDGIVIASASMLGGIADEQPDPQPFWQAIMRFDANHDQQLSRDEMVPPFTFPLRPDLPSDHPGFGFPMPSDVGERARRLDNLFASIDKDQNAAWTSEEFAGALAIHRGKPNLVAVRPGAVGAVSPSQIAWTLHRGIPEVPSPIYEQGRLYLLCDGGLLSCVNGRDGSLIYRERLGTAGHYRASPIIANGHLYAVSEDGVMTVVKTGDRPERVHQIDLQERVAATPAVDASTLYVRTAGHLWAWRD